MRIPIDSQIKFFDLQIREIEEQYQSYLKAPINQHIKNRRAFIGRIWGLDKKRGTVLIRFRKGLSPRLKIPLSGFQLTNDIDPRDNESWDFSYKYFREHYVYEQSDMLPTYYLKSEDSKWSICGFTGADLSFIANVKENIESGDKLPIVLADKDPPIQYLLNLKNFTSLFKNDPILNLNMEKGLETWSPETISSSSDIKSIIYNSICENEITIIQGPPGTGKTHLIADTVSKLIDEGKKVCVTALTNKALVEVAQKSGLKERSDRAIYKTNLSIDEKKLIPHVEEADSLKIGNGELLLSTYYKLSDWYNPNLHHSQISIKPIYDVIIIEEASQAFLTTISAFLRLGEKAIIIGDPLQLQPIVLDIVGCKEIHSGILRFINGLESYASNSADKSFMLTDSYRLSSVASKLTGIFYKDLLRSVQKDSSIPKVSQEFSKFMPIDGGCQLFNIPLIQEGDKPVDAIETACKIAFNIITNNSKFSVAVLAPFRNTVMEIQDRMENLTGDFSGLTIETIDRIQGLTVGFTIFVIPLNNPSFAFNLNRFNVATSRSEYGTLIISDKSFGVFDGINSKVLEYLNSIPIIH